MSYPCVKNDQSDKSNTQQLVFGDVQSVVLLKLSNETSTTNITEILKVFSQHKFATILLLVVSITDISLKAINHIRIMIEEAEREAQSQKKLYVLLLHFPPSSQHYPTLFLNGWDHYYIDTISHNCGETGVLDIENWFKKCCSIDEKIEPDESLLCTLMNLLQESIPVIASQVSFGNDESGMLVFNAKMPLSRRKMLLHQLLIKKKVGEILCKKFRSYWNPSKMASLVEKAAKFSHGQHTALTITDPIQASFKAQFFEFIVWMVAKINEHCNIDILFPNDSSKDVEDMKDVEKLFEDLLDLYSIPEIEELKLPRNSRIIINIPDKLPSFPFYHTIMMQMDQLVEDCRKDVNKTIDLLTDTIPDTPPKATTILIALQKRTEELEKVRNCMHMPIVYYILLITLE